MNFVIVIIMACAALLGIFKDHLKGNAFQRKVDWILVVVIISGAIINFIIQFKQNNATQEQNNKIDSLKSDNRRLLTNISKLNEQTTDLINANTSLIKSQTLKFSALGSSIKDKSDSLNNAISSRGICYITLSQISKDSLEVIVHNMQNYPLKDIGFYVCSYNEIKSMKSILFQGKQFFNMNDYKKSVLFTEQHLNLQPGENAMGDRIALPNKTQAIYLEMYFQGSNVLIGEQFSQDSNGVRSFVVYELNQAHMDRPKIIMKSNVGKGFYESFNVPIGRKYMYF